jgi:Sortase domain
MLAGTAVTATMTRYTAPTNAGALAGAVLQPRGAGLTPGAVAPAAGSRTAVRGAQLLGLPVRLHIPAIAVDAPIVAVSVSSDGALTVPDDPRDVGWWSGSAIPREPDGSVVLDGHVDTARSGAGALFHLANLGPGASVTVSTTAGEIRYVVAARRVYAKAYLPTQVFSHNGPPRLVLVTCGGRFDAGTRHYVDNVVVIATPVSRKDLQ